MGENYAIDTSFLKIAFIILSVQKILATLKPIVLVLKSDVSFAIYYCCIIYVNKVQPGRLL